ATHPITSSARAGITDACAATTTASTFQLTFNVVEEPPVRALRDELLWCALDHASFMEPQGVKAQRVLGISITPPPIWQPCEDLERNIGPRFITLGRQKTRRLLRFLCADIHRLQKGAQRPSGGDRILLNEGPACTEHATEVLRPRSILPGV